ncbi:MAG: response regulator [Cyanobacteria bacterium J06635_1]
MFNDQYVQKIYPAKLLNTVTEEYGSGLLEITSGSVCWKIYLENRRLFYVSYAIKGHPKIVLDRLKQHIYRLNFGNAIAAFESSVQEKLSQSLDGVQFPYYLDYPMLIWLIFEHHLSPSQATKLAHLLFNEALEHLLCVSVGTYHMIHHQAPTFQGLYQPNLSSQIEVGQRRLSAWKPFSPKVSSIHQCPYLIDRSTFCNANIDAHTTAQSNLKTKLAPALEKGYSFWQLATFLKCSELELARFLYPHILNGSIHLKSPASPFDQLPRFWPTSSPVATQSPQQKTQTQGALNLKPLSTHVADRCQNSYSIACIDDSPSTLNQIEHFLDEDNILIFKFSEPTKAVFQIRKINPDIIFLDIGMPKVNGYELCRMVKNHPSTQNIPIVIITGNRGVLNKSKAKSAGASDYITKPFTKSDLLAVIAKHLRVKPKATPKTWYNRWQAPYPTM